MIATAARQAEGLLAGPRRALTIGLVMVVTLVAFEGLAVATVMPAVERDLGGLRLYGWTFSAFLLASLVGTAIAGGMCDRHGPARPFVAGVALFAAGLTAGGLAPSMPVLVGARALQGFGAGALPAVAYVCIGRAYDETQRPRMFAVLSSAWVVPGLAGPVLAGAVAEYASWRLVFLALLPLLGAALALTLPALRRLGAPAVQAASGESPVALAIWLAASAALLLAGLSAGSPVAGASLAVPGLALCALALRRLLGRKEVRGVAGLAAAIGGMGALNFAFFGADAFVPFTLTEHRGQSTVAAGAVLTSATLSWTAATWLQSRAVATWPPARLVRAGSLCIVAGIAGIMAVVSPGVPVALAVVAWGVAGFGMGVAYPTFSLVVLAGAPAGREGAVASSMKLAEVMGSAVAAGAAGAIVAGGDAAGMGGEAAVAAFALMAVAALAVHGIAGALPSRADGAPGAVRVAAEQAVA